MPDVSKGQTGSFGRTIQLWAFIYQLLGTMDMDMESQPPRQSTHGPRGSRREEWRKSKGMPIRPTGKGMNRQGGVAARRKAGRAKRRR